MRKNHVELATLTPSKPISSLKKQTLRFLSAEQLTVAVGGGKQPTLTGNCY